MRFIIQLLFVLNNTDPAVDRVWKRTMGGVVTVLVVVALVAGFWIHGWVPSVATAAELQKYAPANSVQRLADGQKQLALVIFKGAFKTALIERCNAIRRQNQEALTAANSSLDDLTDQFRALAVPPPEMKSCDVVLISPPVVQ